jgi:hypothetical protein
MGPGSFHEEAFSPVRPGKRPNDVVAGFTHFEEDSHARQIHTADFCDSAVQKMYIGIGNPDAPTPGGAGMLYIDDIRATKPEQVAGG